MDSLLKKSTNPYSFRREAISKIGAIVKAREFLVIKCKSKTPVSEEIRKPVREQYEAYKTSWSVRGVAKFLIKYQDNLRMMATGGEDNIKRLNNLIHQAYHYETI